MTAPTRPVRVVIDLDTATQPIRATLAGPDGAPRQYVGWLALIAALEGLSAEPTSEPVRPGNEVGA